MNIDKVLTHFERVVQTSPKTWKASCPAHKDDRPSLSITAQHNRILLHCHAGCSFKEVIACARLSPADLHEGRQSTANAIIATYDYYDQRGKLAFQVCRTTGKGFFQRHLGENGEWIPNLKGVDRVLYRLPELTAARGGRQVFVVEGEKDVDRLMKLGFVATCNSGGAGKWFSYYSEDLEGRHVVIIPDNDEPGKKHAEDIRSKLTNLAASIRKLELPGLPAGGDVSDWLNEGHTAEDLKQLVAKTPTVGEEPSAPPSGISSVELAHCETPPITYTVPDLIPEGVTLFAGAPKSGKSWFCLDLAIAVASGGYALGKIPVEPHEVLYLALEDNLRRLKERQRKLLNHTDGCPGLTFALEWPRLDSVSGGLNQLKNWVRAQPACRLIVIDTLARVKSAADKNAQAYDADTKALAGLQNFAGENGLSIILVHHTRKAEAEDPFDAVSGTLALTGVADTTMILKHPKGSPHGELFVTGRDVRHQHLALRWGEDSATWFLLGDAENVASSENRQQVLDFINEADRCVGPKEIAEALRRQPRDVQKILKALTEKGKIKKVDRGRYCSLSLPNPSETPKRENGLFDESKKGQPSNTDESPF